MPGRLVEPAGLITMGKSGSHLVPDGGRNVGMAGWVVGSAGTA